MCDNNPDNIAEGDFVYLRGKSNSPRMTVVSILKCTATCEWLVGNEPKGNEFELSELTVVDPRFGAFRPR
jgi:hypothetical protein